MRSAAIEAHRLSPAGADYVNAASALWRYFGAIQQSNLPVLTRPPEKYDDCLDAWITARIHARVWVDEFFPSFSNFAQVFVNNDGFVRDEFDGILSAIVTLRTNPNDAKILQRTRERLDTVGNQAEAGQVALTKFNNRMQLYINRIEPSAERLSSYTVQIASTLKADERAIAKLYDVNTKLQAIINSRNALSTLNTSSNVVLNVFVAAVGAVIGLPFSLATGAIVAGGLGVLAGIVTAIVPVHPDIEYEQSIKDIQREMDAVSKEIGLENTIVAALRLLSEQLHRITLGNGDAAVQASTVKAYWHLVQEDLTSMAQQVATVHVRLSDSQLDDAESAARTALKNWDQAISRLQEIKDLTYVLQTDVQAP